MAATHNAGSADAFMRIMTEASLKKRLETIPYAPDARACDIQRFPLSKKALGSRVRPRTTAASCQTLWGEATAGGGGRSLWGAGGGREESILSRDEYEVRYAQRLAEPSRAHRKQVLERLRNEMQIISPRGFVRSGPPYTSEWGEERPGSLTDRGGSNAHGVPGWKSEMIPGSSRLGLSTARTGARSIPFGEDALRQDSQLRALRTARQSVLKVTDTLGLPEDPLPFSAPAFTGTGRDGRGTAVGEGRGIGHGGLVGKMRRHTRATSTLAASRGGAVSSTHQLSLRRVSVQVEFQLTLILLLVVISFAG